MVLAWSVNDLAQKSRNNKRNDRHDTTSNIYNSMSSKIAQFFRRSNVIGRSYVSKTKSAAAGGGKPKPDFSAKHLVWKTQEKRFSVATTCALLGKCILSVSPQKHFFLSNTLLSFRHRHRITSWRWCPRFCLEMAKQKTWIHQSNAPLAVSFKV